jgi:hypothetical protein
MNSATSNKRLTGAKTHTFTKLSSSEVDADPTMRSPDTIQILQSMVQVLKYVS